MDLTFWLIACLVFLILYFWLRKPDKSLPPFPVRPLPIVGNFFHMTEDTRPQFRAWRKQCGDIYSLYMGGCLLVVLNGYDLIKEALVKKADVFSDRPPFFFDKASNTAEGGVITSNGHIWKEHRSVTLSILRAFGMGKNLLAQKIEEEVLNFTDHLKSLKGKATDIRLKTNISTCNVICSILIGHRFEYDDADFHVLLSRLETLAGDQQPVSLINFVPWLKYLPGDFFNAKKLTKSTNAIFAHLRTYIKQKQRNVEDSNDVCNLIDAYLIERNKKFQAGLPTTLDDNGLIKIMNDLFGAGTETTSTTIYWFVLYMLHYPDIQDKIYNEIKEKVGTNRTPTMQDKSQLVFLNAAITETQRLSSIVPMSVPHTCTEDVVLRGYTIPKGTFIVPSLDSVLHDTQTWGDDAMSFRPERLIENGKLKIPEQFIPFSLGRRVCLGEALAKMELFLFLSSMFQKFQFLPPNPYSIPPLKYHCGFVMLPINYEVRILERKRN